MRASGAVARAITLPVTYRPPFLSLAAEDPETFVCKKWFLPGFAMARAVSVMPIIRAPAALGEQASWPVRDCVKPTKYSPRRGRPRSVYLVGLCLLKIIK